MIIGIIVSVLATAALATGLVHSRASSRYSDLGALYGESLKIKESKQRHDDAWIRGKHFSVSKEEFENMVEQNEITGMDRADAEEMAYCQFVVSRAVYGQAIDDGFLIDKDAVKAQIDLERDAIMASESKDSFLAYLEGAGLTEDEYWSSMYDTYLRTMTVARYTEAIREAFLEKNQPDAAAWSEYCIQITQEILKKQEIFLKDESAWSLTAENYNNSGVWPPV